MPKVSYRKRDGAVRVVELAVGESVMEGALRNNIPGIDAECGGGCACATCHVHVDEAWIDRLEEKSMIEDAMLVLAHDADHTSRLSCQIRMTDALDGLIVRIPSRQR